MDDSTTTPTTPGAPPPLPAVRPVAITVICVVGIIGVLFTIPLVFSDIARQIAGALNRPLGPVLVQQRPRYSRDPLAYAEFMRGYRLSATGDPATMEKAMHHLTSAVTRDPAFARLVRPCGIAAKRTKGELARKKPPKGRSDELIAG